MKGEIVFPTDVEGPWPFSSGRDVDPLVSFREIPPEFSGIPFGSGSGIFLIPLSPEDGKDISPGTSGPAGEQRNRIGAMPGSDGE